MLRVQDVSEIHRPRWEGDPTSPHRSEVHITVSNQGADAHLIFTEPAIVALIRQLEAIIPSGCDHA